MPAAVHGLAESGGLSKFIGASVVLAEANFRLGWSGPTSIRDRLAPGSARSGLMPRSLNAITGPPVRCRVDIGSFRFVIAYVRDHRHDLSRLVYSDPQG